MEQSYMPEREEQGSIVRGFIGALLGGILGAIVAGIFYLILNQSNTLLGFLIGFLIGTGYNLFKGRKGIPQLLVGIVCCLLAVLLAETIFYVGLIEKDYAEAVEKLEAAGISKSSPLYPTRDECYDFYLNDEEAIDAFKKDVTTSLLLVGGPAIISVVGIFINDRRKGEVPVSDDSNAPSDPPAPDNDFA